MDIRQSIKRVLIIQDLFMFFYDMDTSIKALKLTQAVGKGDCYHKGMFLEEKNS